MNSESAAIHFTLADHPRMRRFLNLRRSRYFPLATFFAGFLWDSLTLTRVDRMSDNLILLAYLAALAVMIILTLRRQEGGIRARWATRLEVHFPWAIQFLMGGLLSSYVIFYFKSASWTQTSVFFILLVVLLVSNEFLDHRLENPKLLAVAFTFCLFSFLVFFLPVVLARLGTPVFLLAGVVSLSLSGWVFALAFPVRSEGYGRKWRQVASYVFGTFLTLNLLYFANLIPPVPLSLKSSGIYHHIRKTTSGYEVQSAPTPWYRFWKRWDDPFTYTEGDAAYCYTAIFAPPDIRVPVEHLWSRRVPGSGWILIDRVRFEITGGREGGYRGFSNKSAIVPGRWRVEVGTRTGQILGRIDFTVIPAPEPRPTLVTRMIP